MLAQNFKSATDLRITEEQYDALIKTLVLMETGKLIHVENFDDDEVSETDEGNKTPITFHFNMESWAVKHNCGTVRCIGGTAEAIGKVRFDTQPDELNMLFYPHGVFSWEKITVEQGARALRNYLTYGEPRWHEVMENNNG